LPEVDRLLNLETSFHAFTSSLSYVPPDARIATFDQDGTTWVSHPMYTQLVFCLDRVPAVVTKHPELHDAEPFKTVLSGDRTAIAKLSKSDLEKISMKKDWNRLFPFDKVDRGSTVGERERQPRPRRSISPSTEGSIVEGSVLQGMSACTFCSAGRVE
jgi:hypothetical protein